MMTENNKITSSEVIAEMIKPSLSILSDPSSLLDSSSIVRELAQNSSIISDFTDLSIKMNNHGRLTQKETSTSLISVGTASTMPSSAALVSPTTSSLSSASCHSSPTHCSSKPKQRTRIKITVLNLTGITVRTKSVNNQNLAVTAAVSFSGSCDPQDIRVLSSEFCSSSQRLVVESSPIVVPNGMTDSLIATWNDNICNTRYNMTTSSPSFGEEKGSILAKEKTVLPHLVVSLQGYESITCCGQASPTSISKNDDGTMEESVTDDEQEQQPIFHIDVLSPTRPDIDFTDKNTLSMLQQWSETKGINTTKIVHEILPEAYPVELPIQGKHFDSNTTNKTLSVTLCDHTISTENNITSDNLRQSLSTNGSHLDASQTIINTPSQQQHLLDRFAPEILEFNVSLRIHNVQTQDRYNTGAENGETERRDEEVYNINQSSCFPTAYNRDTVAHLVLFPDIIRDPSLLSSEIPENESSITTEDLDLKSSCNPVTSRIIELPLRRKRSTLELTDVSSISDLTCQCQSVASSSENESKQFYPTGHSTNSDADALFVDLDDDAIITIQLQECSEEDNEALDKKDRLLFEQHRGSFSPLYSNVSLMDHMDKRDDADDSDEFPSPNILIKNSNNADCASNELNADLAATYDEYGYGHAEEKAIKNSMIESYADDEVIETKWSCNNAFQLENLLNIFLGIIANCGDDVDLYHLANNHSMDSSIQTI